jgi:hypothetical protein
MNMNSTRLLDRQDELTQFAVHIHATALAKGWWSQPREDGTLLALMHEEISEADEAIVSGNGPSEKIPAFSGAEEELADLIIRILDYGEHKGWNLPERIASLCPNRDYIARHSADPCQDALAINALHRGISAALTALRKSDETEAQHQLAATAITALIYSVARGWHLEKALVAKAKFNEGRSHRHGGKKF